MPGKKAFNLYRKFTTIICITNIFLKCRTTHYYKLMTTVLAKRKKNKRNKQMTGKENGVMLKEEEVVNKMRDDLYSSLGKLV